MSMESEAVKTVAGLVALSARTAPKAMGVDSIVVKIVIGKEQDELSKKMEEIGTARNLDYFIVNGAQVKESDATVLIGVTGQKVMGGNCGGCGFSTCAEMAKAYRKDTNSDSDYPGPNCVLKVTDLGVAVGSAVKTAAMHNVDNRVMYTAGVAAIQIGLLEGCSVAYGIPLKALGVDIYFNAAMRH